MALAIEVSNVSKSFRRHRPDRPMLLQEILARGLNGFRTTEQFWALRDVSFSVPPGRAVGIIGTNGSGKSTLLRLVCGIGSADSGQVRVAGRVSALLDLGAGLHGDLSGRENVIVAGVLNGLSRREVLRRFDAIVAFSEIEKFIDNPMRTYSSGMQMRLAFAINVHTNPDVLLIDEVLAVGDAAFQRKCFARISEFKANGCSILLVSHGLAAVRTLCDEVLWMNAGRLMAQGPVREVVRQYEAHVGHTMEPDDVQEVAAAVQVAVPGTPAAPAAAVEHEVPSGDAVTGRPTESVRIAAVGLLDGAGHPLVEFRAGQPLRVEICFDADAVATRHRFRVRVVREDGLVCCDVVSDGFQTAGPPVVRRGRMTLVLDRLDLSSGHYRVDAMVHAAEAQLLDGTRAPGCALVVLGEGGREAALEVPHRWEIDVRMMDTVGLLSTQRDG